jgi:hypothetical protein
MTNTSEILIASDGGGGSVTAALELDLEPAWDARCLWCDRHAEKSIHAKGLHNPLFHRSISSQTGGLFGHLVKTNAISGCSHFMFEGWPPLIFRRVDPDEAVKVGQTLMGAWRKRSRTGRCIERGYSTPAEPPPERDT